jgi:hypothetical protein
LLNEANVQNEAKLQNEANVQNEASSAESLKAAIRCRELSLQRAMVGRRSRIWRSALAYQNPTIARLESADGELGGREGTGEKIRKAIENGIRG